MRLTPFAICCSLMAAWPALAAEPTSALLYPLDVVPSPGLTEPAEALQKRFLSVAREHAGAVLLLRKEVELAIKAVGPKDYARSDDALAQLAATARAPVAIYVRFSLTPANELSLEGRMVKASGERVATASLVQPRGPGSLLDALGAAVPEFFARLKKGDAAPPPAQKPPPVAQVEPPPPLPSPEPALPPPPPPPGLERPAAAPTPLRTTGLIVGGLGAAGAVVGAILYATAGTVSRDPQGNILASDAPRVTSIRTQQGVGLGVLVAGGAIAATGVVLALLAPSAPVSAAVQPTAEGAVFSVGGRF